MKILPIEKRCQTKEKERNESHYELSFPKFMWNGWYLCQKFHDGTGSLC